MAGFSGQGMGQSGGAAGQQGATGPVSDVTATAPLTSSGGATPDISTSIATARVVGRTTAGTGVMEELTVTAPLALGTGTLTTSLATNKLLGRATAGTGALEAITLGTNLSFTGTTLNASGGGGGTQGGSTGALTDAIVKATSADTLADTALTESSGVVSFPDVGKIQFSSTGVATGTADVALKRESAGRLRITDAVSNTTADLTMGRLDTVGLINCGSSVSGDGFALGISAKSGERVYSSWEIGWVPASDISVSADLVLARAAAGVLKICTATGATGTGAILATRVITAKTADYTVTAAETGTVFTNTGASGTVVFTLPASPANGLTYEFHITAAQSVDIKTGTAVLIYANAAATTATTGKLTKNTVGTCIQLVYNGVAWMGVGQSGTWTVS